MAFSLSPLLLVSLSSRCAWSPGSWPSHSRSLKLGSKPGGRRNCLPISCCRRRKHGQGTRPGGGRAGSTIGEQAVTFEERLETSHFLEMPGERSPLPIIENGLQLVFGNFGRLPEHDIIVVHAELH